MAKAKKVFYHVHISKEAHASLKKLAAKGKTSIRVIVDGLLAPKKK